MVTFHDPSFSPWLSKYISLSEIPFPLPNYLWDKPIILQKKFHEPKISCHFPIQNQIHMGESLSIPAYSKGNMVIPCSKYVFWLNFHNLLGKKWSSNLSIHILKCFKIIISIHSCIYRAYIRGRKKNDPKSSYNASFMRVSQATFYFVIKTRKYNSYIYDMIFYCTLYYIYNKNVLLECWGQKVVEL